MKTFISKTCATKYPPCKEGSVLLLLRAGLLLGTDIPGRQRGLHRDIPYWFGGHSKGSSSHLFAPQPPLHVLPQDLTSTA